MSKKGAYENCGAMTHKSKDCMMQNWSDAKRNRWNDYDPSEHSMKRTFNGDEDDDKYAERSDIPSQKLYKN
nr:10083_t:CDS:2 [Entrophospora candida]